MAYYNKFEEEQNKLSFRDWKVFIDNTSQWFDDINKKLSFCYSNTNLLKQIYPQIRSFTSSRKANLYNFDKINNKLNQVRDVLFSKKYNDLKSTGDVGEWDNKILAVLDEVIQLLSIGLSEGELTPKPNKEQKIPYEKEGNAKDFINKALTKNNNTSINKNGEITTNNY